MPDTEVVEQAPAESEAEERIRKVYEERFRVWKAKELADLKQEQDKVIQEQLQDFFKKQEEANKPLTLDQIKTLLEQEYAEVPITVITPDDEGKDQTFKFVLRELPQSVEKKFYKQFKDRFKEKSSEVAAFTQRNMDKTFEETITAFMDTFESAFDVLADGVVLCLNPFGKNTMVTVEWVQNNISSNRQLSIILAQAEINKLRDFFSRLFQSSQRAGLMTMPQNSPQSRRLVR